MSPAELRGDALPLPAGWRPFLPVAIVCPRRVYQLADGTFVRADDSGHLDVVVQGGAPGLRSIASDPSATRSERSK